MQMKWRWEEEGDDGGGARRWVQQWRREEGMGAAVAVDECGGAGDGRGRATKREGWGDGSDGEPDGENGSDGRGQR